MKRIKLPSQFILPLIGQVKTDLNKNSHKKWKENSYFVPYVVANETQICYFLIYS